MVTIRKELAYKMAQAYVEVYNNQYNELCVASRVIYLRTLKEDLAEIGFHHLIAAAKGTLEERHAAFKIK
jgi:hypothetical protein